MSEPAAPLLRVRNWDRLYENNRSRELGRTAWFPAPNDLSAYAYVEIVTHEQGAAHFGIWNAVLMVASKTKPRCGLLVTEDGRPHTAESLARVTRLPQTVVQDALGRFLEIGLLEVVAVDSPEINNLPPHPRAERPQEDAAEGKGTEHHHQGKGTEGKRTERAGDEFATEHSGAVGAQPDFPKNGDDGEKPREEYATPEDELKAIYQTKAAQSITIRVLDAIRVNLELNRVSMGEFVSVVRTHLAGQWENPAGFLRYLSKNFRAKAQPASEPITMSEAEQKNYRCLLCHSIIRGEGAVPGLEGKLVPCVCASPDWIERQRARGVFAAEPAQ